MSDLYPPGALAEMLRLEREDLQHEALEADKELRFHSLLAGGEVTRPGGRFPVSFGEVLTEMPWDEETDELQRKMAEARYEGDHEKMLAAAVELSDWMLEQVRERA